MTAIYGRRIDFLREQAARLGLSKDEIRKHGNLAKTGTWERAINHAQKPAAPLAKMLRSHSQQVLQPSRILCPTCLGKYKNCQRCEGTGKIFNIVRFGLRYFGTSRLPEGGV